MKLKALKSLSVKPGVIITLGDTFEGTEDLIKAGLAEKADPPKPATKPKKEAGA